MTVRDLVEGERSRLRRMHLLVGAGLAVGATCLTLALGIAILGEARWMALPRPLPFLVWLLVLAADTAVILWTVRQLTRGTTRETIAATIEREQSMRAGSVRGAMEVGQSGALGRYAEAAVTAQLGSAGTRLAPAEHRRLVRGVARAGIVAILALAALLIAAPNFNDGLLAVLRPVSAWKGTLLPRLSFANLPPTVMRGETVRLQVVAARRGSVTVSQRMPGETWTSRRIPVDASTGTATIQVGPVRGDMTLVASDGRSSSDTAVVRATDRPFVGAVSLRATYPAYLGRASEALAGGEIVRVPQGTVIDISGQASTILRDVRLVSVATTPDTVSLGVSDHAFTGRLHATTRVRYIWVANSLSGTIADVPGPLELDVIPDSVPRVELVSPTVDTIVAADDRIQLHATASDDHGIGHVELVSWKQGGTGGATAPVRSRIADGASTVWDGTAIVDMEAQGLRAGEALHVRIEATDNSPWAQRGASRELVLKNATLEERRAQVRAALDSAVSQVQAVAAAQKSLEERTSDAARSRATRNSMDDPNRAGGDETAGSLSFDAAEKAKAVSKDQRALTERVKQLQQTAATLQQQLTKAGVLDSSIARQLQEAQALLRDALTPELLAEMNKLDGATQQLSQDRAQMTLEQLRAMQQKLREQLEKSAEMLKRAALEGAMQTLTDEAKDIAARDRALADSSSGARPSAQDADTHRVEAKHLSDRSQRFEDDVTKLQSRLDQANANAAASGAEEARKHASVAQQTMANASKEDGTAQQSRAAASQMTQASAAMQQARDAQVRAWKSELTRELDQSIEEMLQLARQEQQLARKTQSGTTPQEEVRGEQSAVKQGLDNAATRLQQQGQKTTLLSGRSQRSVADAQKEVSTAMGQTRDARDSRQAASTMEDAVEALNRAASSLARDREKANTATSATGFAEMMQELQDAAKKQGAINAQAQGMFPGLGQPMSAQQQATARVLAHQQREVAQQLDDVGDAVGGDRAAQLAGEAKQLADALDAGRIDASTLARQQQLFRRLLDAGKSLQKDDREDTGQREATAAKAGNEFAPENGSSAGLAANRFQAPTWEELRGLSADERRAILDYFKRINASVPER